VAASGPAAAAAASALQTDVVLDPPGTRSLDQAIEQARLRVAPRAGLLVVQADLPLLQADDIRAVIEQDAPVVVAPTSDGGTSALLRRPSGVIGTAFGRGSGRAHVRLAEDAEVPVAVVRRPGLAHDVDDLGDLTASRARWDPPRDRRARSAGAGPGAGRQRVLTTLRPHPTGADVVQGTVKSFDPETRRSVLLDDGLRELEVDAEAFAASGLLELRIGQRVRFELTTDGDTERVTHLGIVSM
jgi:2-phospho-L-lactate guanylyltransferase